MLFFLVFHQCLSFTSNLTIDFHGGMIKNPEYLIVSTYFKIAKQISIYNSFFSKSFSTSIFHSKGSSIRIHKSSFLHYLEPGIRTIRNIYNPGCNTGRISNQGSAYFDSVEVIGCTFDNLGSQSSGMQGGAIGLQNMQYLRIQDCVFTNCNAVQGGAFWIYQCQDLSIVNTRVSNCQSGRSGSGGFIIMNSNIHVSQVLVNNCYEGSDGSTGTVYIQNCQGVFQYTTLSNNNAKNVQNTINLYAYLAFQGCTNFQVSDICFDYTDALTGQPFMKMLVQDCTFSQQPGVDKITFPQFEESKQMGDLIFVLDQNEPVNPQTAFNSTQNSICHLDNYVFNVGIVTPSETHLFQTPSLEEDVSTPTQQPELITPSEQITDLIPPSTISDFLHTISPSDSEYNSLYDDESTSLYDNESFLDNLTGYITEFDNLTFTETAIPEPSLSQQDDGLSNTSIIIIVVCVIVILIIIAIILLVLYIKFWRTRVAFQNEDTESSVDYEVPLVADAGDSGDHAILSANQI